MKTQAKKVCKISENNCGAIMKVKVKKGDRGRPHQVLLTWSRGSENGKLAKKSCGAIVKVKEEQWSFSSGDLVNTRTIGKLAKVYVQLLL